MTTRVVDTKLSWMSPYEFCGNPPSGSVYEWPIQSLNIFARTMQLVDNSNPHVAKL